MAVGLFAPCWYAWSEVFTMPADILGVEAPTSIPDGHAAATGRRVTKPPLSRR